MRRGIAACLAFLMAVIALAAAGSAAERVLPTREYFENLDPESSLQDIVEAAGPYGVQGSGIVRFVWPLEDGSVAQVILDSQGRIEMIYTTGENRSERIYEREYPVTGSGAGRTADTAGIDLEKAAGEMREAIGNALPAGGRMLYSDPAEPGYELFDVTGDGCDDLCTCVTWGSGMVRTDLVVYDPLEKILYILDGYNYSYLIDRVEEDRLVIAMKGPYGYNEPVLTTYGTVMIEDDKLVFVPDPEER